MAPIEAVDAVMVLLDQLEEVLGDLRRHLQDMKERDGDDDAAPRT
jgi:hypothetical protein